MSRSWNHNLDTIQKYLLQYAHRNLIDTEKQSQLLEKLLEDYPYLNSEHIPQDIHVSIPLSDCKRVNTKQTPKHIDHVFDIDIADKVLTEEQQHVMDNIVQNSYALHILIGTPRSGKIFFVKYTAQLFSKP